MIDISTQYAGLNLRNPIIVGSSGLTRKPEQIKEFEKAGAGAVVLKSLFEEQIDIHSSRLMQESDYPEAADYIHEYVRSNQIQEYLDLIKQAKETSTIPIIASINCYKSEAWIEFAQHIQAAGGRCAGVKYLFPGNRPDSGLRCDPRKICPDSTQNQRSNHDPGHPEIRKSNQ